jgi:DNA-binding CsgD family transcriptional regulator
VFEQPAIASCVSSVKDLLRLREAVRKSGVAVGLVELPERRFLEVSPAARVLVSLRSPEWESEDLVTMAIDPGSVRRALDLMNVGAIYSCRIRTGFKVAGSEIPLTVSLRTVGHGDGRVYALALFDAPDAERLGAPDRRDFTLTVAADAGQGPRLHHGTEATFSERLTIEDLFGLLLDLAGPADVADLLTFVEDALASDPRIVLHERPNHTVDTPRHVEIVMSRVDHVVAEPAAELATPSGIAPSTGGRGRLADLEMLFKRISGEIERAGESEDVYGEADVAQFPGLEDLTPRQFEILTRLLGGQRVATISRGVHLSPSTVRNHLTTIYRKIGVHSQAELLECLVAYTGGVPAAS